jgi:tripartite-type tricarboxylate transporter receptor subunit TctC
VIDLSWPHAGCVPMQGLRRLALVVAALLLALLGLFIGPAQAQQHYPSKPIRLIVPFPAGGSSDSIGRQIASKLGPLLKQPVRVENKAGAGGVLGADLVAKAAPDGHTLLLVDVFHTSIPIYTRNMPYDALKDFSPVSLVGHTPAFWIAGPHYPVKTAREALAQARAQPGQMRMAIAGTGSVVVDLFRARTGLQFTSVPYRGASPALGDLVHGQVDAMITTLASAGSHLKAGKLRALAVTGAHRNPQFPDVPTFAELGVAGMEYEQWFGLMGPADMPAAVVGKLSRAMEQVLQMPEVRKHLGEMAVEVAAPGPRVMLRQLEDDLARWTRLAMALDIKPFD